MSVQAFRRSAVRRVDWAWIGANLNGQAAASFNEVRAYYAEAQATAEFYKEAPPPIDFDAYREKIKTPGLVDMMQKEYEALEYPDGDLFDFFAFKTIPEFAEALKEHQADVATANEEAAKLYKDAADNMEKSKKRLDFLYAEKAFLERTKTNEYTTVGNIFYKMPGIQEIVYEEVDDYELNRNMTLP